MDKLLSKEEEPLSTFFFPLNLAACTNGEKKVKSTEGKLERNYSKKDIAVLASRRKPTPNQVLLNLVLGTGKIMDEAKESIVGFMDEV